MKKLIAMLVILGFTGVMTLTAQDKATKPATTTPQDNGKDKDKGEHKGEHHKHHHHHDHDGKGKGDKK
jgi:hypothetical protein